MDIYGNIISSEPLTVVINCTITNEVEQLRGIAIEAINGGNVTIQSRQDYLAPGEQGHNDTIILNGDVYAGMTTDNLHNPNAISSLINIDTKAGDDLVSINGITTLEKGGHFLIAAGKGNDSVLFAGDINLNTLGYLDILAGEGHDLISIDGNIKVDGMSNMSIDAGSGNDVIILNGGISGSNANGGLQISGGDGHDMLILKAPDAATFNEWYKGWLENYGLLNLDCESITVQGIDDATSIAWLSELVNETNALNGKDITLQIIDTHSNLTVVADGASIDDSFILNGAGDSDMLHVRFDYENDSLDGLSHAITSGHISGVEYLVLDLANPHLYHELDFSKLNSFIGTVKNDTNEPDNILLKADADDTLGLQNNGWTTAGNTESINSVEYTVYQHDDYGSLYVQLISQ